MRMAPRRHRAETDKSRCVIGSTGDNTMTMTHKKWREHRYYKIDPFADEIQPALLNSADIEKYVDKECLIEQDDFKKERLKAASYKIRFLGMLYDWEVKDDGRLQRRCIEISEGTKITLPRNSITYLWTKERLRLPEYIAARFDLHIHHVHKGILLGTGPMIDPGFFGEWLIPLHNLTALPRSKCCNIKPVLEHFERGITRSNYATE